MAHKPKETCCDQYGEIRLVVRAEGYCMIRRKDCMPFLVTEAEWQRMMGRPSAKPSLQIVK